MNVKRFLSLLSMVAMVAYLVPTAYAANLTLVKDTLSNSAPSENSNHEFEFTTATLTPTGGSFKLVFPLDLVSEFDLTTTALGVEDFDVMFVAAEQTLVVAEPAAGEVQVDLTDVSTGIIVFDLGSTVALPATTKVTVRIGLNALSGGTGDTQIVNPSVTGPYSISVTTHGDDVGTMKADGITLGLIDEQNDVVHINDTVSVTATVQSSLTFIINGQASGTACANSGSADVTTTSTTIPFGNLATATPKIACQELIVSTNATNGYVVTLQQNDDLTSAGADTIKKFVGTDGTPVTWASPAGTGTVPNRLNGHFGYTTDDTGYSQYQPTKFAGIAADDTPYSIVTEAGPVSNETNIISYEIEVDGLQEAGTYTNTLMYICTATF